MNTRFLRLFPLESVVLLPGALLPLVVFEQRYLQLTQECLDSNEPFGIVLLRQGREAGDSESVPYTIGTTAKIEEVQNEKSGRLHIQVRGMERFEIKELNNTTPYLSAEVEILEDSKFFGVPSFHNPATEEQYWECGIMFLFFQLCLHVNFYVIRSFHVPET